MITYKNIIKVSLTEAKILYKSFWSLIYFAPIIAMSYLTFNAFFHSTGGDNVGTWVNQYSYITVYMSFALLIIGVFMAHQKNDIIDSVLMPVSKNIGKFLGLLLFASSALIIPVIVVIILNCLRPVGPSLFLNYFLYIIFHWFLQIFFSLPWGFQSDCFSNIKLLII